MKWFNLNSLTSLANIINNKFKSLTTTVNDTFAEVYENLEELDNTKAEINHEHDIMLGATASNDGKSGLVPVPTIADENSFLKGNGTWGKIEGFSYDVATTTENGLMSATDKSKLDKTNIAYATCSTGSDVAEKVVTINSQNNTNWSLTNGSIINIKFSYDNTATNPTLNVNGTGAKQIIYSNETIKTSKIYCAGIASQTFSYMYNGTGYVFMGGIHFNDTTNATLGQGYGNCSTATDTLEKIVTIDNYERVKGGIIVVKFTYDVPANATLNINSLGAKNIQHKGVNIKTGVIKAGDTASFIYNGSTYVLVSTTTDIDTTYTNMKGANASTAGQSGLVPAPVAGEQGLFLRGDGKWASSVTYSTFNPQANGTASPGVGTAVARYDHVHPEQTNTATATALKNKRNIDGIYFDGTKNIIHFAKCTTAADVVEKTVELENFTLTTGSRITIAFQYTNTAANPTLNVNGTGAKSIIYSGGTASNLLIAANNYNRMQEFVYNGLYWILQCPNEMTGATESKDGITGLVPAPDSGKENAFLKGDGAWSTVPVDSISGTLPIISGGTGGTDRATALYNLSRENALMTDSDGNESYDLNLYINIGYWYFTGTQGANLVNAPETRASYLMVLQGGGANRKQIWMAQSGSESVHCNIYVRNSNGSTDTWTSWAKITTGNDLANYLALSGGEMTAPISSSVLTDKYLAGNQGTAIINSTATGYVALAKLNSTNGYFTIASHGNKMLVTYTDKATVEAGTNSTTKALQLIAEDGNSIFPGTITANGSLVVTEGRTADTISGTSSIALGANNTATSPYTVTIGRSNTASVNYAVAIGRDNNVSGQNSFGVGRNNTITSSDCASFGHGNNINSASGYAIGSNNTVSGTASFSLGNGNTASCSGVGALAIGSQCNSTNNYAVTVGHNLDNNSQSAFVCGRFNNTLTDNENINSSTTGDVFAIGNGTGGTSVTRSNAFRVTYTGVVYGQGAYNTSGADYAEFIKEWYDGNPNNEDRVGYMVTIKDGKLHKANDGDYILGVTSGNPSVVGNSDEDYYWKYERDEFNRYIYEDVEEEVQTTDDEGNLLYDEDGNPIYVKTGNIIKNGRIKLSNNYDPSLQDSYIERSQRPEWDYVGMRGIIPVRDDGTCEVGGFCKCSIDGIATKAETRGFDTYFVIERISDNVVSIEVK